MITVSDSKLAQRRMRIRNQKSFREAVLKITTKWPIYEENLNRKKLSITISLTYSLPLFHDIFWAP